MANFKLAHVLFVENNYLSPEIKRESKSLRHCRSYGILIGKCWNFRGIKKDNDI